jgi:hypothetical protein
MATYISKPNVCTRRVPLCLSFVFPLHTPSITLRCIPPRTTAAATAAATSTCTTIATVTTTAVCSATALLLLCAHLSLQTHCCCCYTAAAAATALTHQNTRELISALASALPAPLPVLLLPLSKLSSPHRLSRFWMLAQDTARGPPLLLDCSSAA